MLAWGRGVSKIAKKGLTNFMDSPLGNILKSCFINCFVPLLVRFKYVPALTNGQAFGHDIMRKGLSLKEIENSL